jgi:cysteine desulfurase / selenocysteine lyase
MAADDPSGFLPPHELRAFLASVASPEAVASQTTPSPGITPLGAAPTPPITVPDPFAFPPQAVQSVINVPFLDGISAVPAPHTPTAETIVPPSPGISPQLVAAQPPATLPTEPVAPAAPAPPLETAVTAPGTIGYLPLVDLSSPPPSAPIAIPGSIDIAPAFTDALFELPEVEHVSLVESPSPTLESRSQFDPHVVRRDFPILEERVHGKRLVWLDNAATTQKPRAVIDRLVKYYEHENSNVHRAAHALAARATDAYEGARETTRRFLNASSPSEIVFVRGATEGINLIAKAWGKRYIERGDEIVLTHLEHHANIVPWQQLCSEVGARLRVAPVDDRGDVILDEYEKLMCSRTKLVAFTQVSNALGTVTPAREMIEIAHRWGATVVLDGAQAVSHMPVDVQALDCDFYVFSGHKVFAPTGIGAVFGKRPLLDAMPPWQGGGNMIRDVTFERTLYQDPPWRFEAGTGNIADAAGMATALDYVMRLGMAAIDRYEHELMAYAHAQLETVRGLHFVGNPREKAGVLSFVLDGHRTEDVGAALDQEGIAVRSGHHCAQPILRRFGLESSVRASLALYNVCEDIDALTNALRRLQASV